MKFPSIAIFSLVMLTSFGCGHIHIPFLDNKSDDKAQKAQKQETQLTEFVKRGRIVNEQKLKQARNIVIIPFTAGEGAEATDELDRVALMIVKGIIDAFKEDRTGKHDHFNVLMNDSSENAELIVSGHIVDMRGTSKVKRWMLLSGKKRLGVEGKITDIKTNESVVLFSDVLRAESNDDYKQMGYDIGKNIGQFILSGI